LTIVSLVGHTDRGLLELLVAAVSDDSELRAEPSTWCASPRRNASGIGSGKEAFEHPSA
jgi:hypothetical protein